MNLRFSCFENFFRYGIRHVLNARLAIWHWTWKLIKDTTSCRTVKRKLLSKISCSRDLSQFFDCLTTGIFQKRKLPLWLKHLKWDDWLKIPNFSHRFSCLFFQTIVFCLFLFLLNVSITCLTGPIPCRFRESQGQVYSSGRRSWNVANQSQFEDHQVNHSQSLLIIPFLVANFQFFFGNSWSI